MRQLMSALNRGINISSVLIFVAAIPIIFLIEIQRPVQLIFVVLTGLAVGTIIGKSTEIYTSGDYRFTKEIAEQGETGPATVIISGLAVGMESTGVPVVAIAVGIALRLLSGGRGRKYLARAVRRGPVCCEHALNAGHHPGHRRLRPHRRQRRRQR